MSSDFYRKTQDEFCEEKYSVSFTDAMFKEVREIANILHVDGEEAIRRALSSFRSQLMGLRSET